MEVTKISILQELASIRKQIGKDEFSLVKKFLKEHREYTLSDIYYNEVAYNQYKNWKKSRG